MVRTSGGPSLYSFHMLGGFRSAAGWSVVNASMREKVLERRINTDGFDQVLRCCRSRVRPLVDSDRSGRSIRDPGNGWQYHFRGSFYFGQVRHHRHHRHHRTVMRGHGTARVVDNKSPRPLICP